MINHQYHMLIQKGKDIDLMLEAKNRCEAGQTAPPQGLTYCFSVII